MDNKIKLSEKEKRNIYTKKYREKYHEKFLVDAKKWRNSISGKYNHYKNKAKSKNRAFELSKQEFEDIIKSNCYYCGASTKIGIDRKDNNLGYIKENCAPCCWRCNKIKGRANYEEFFEMCVMISKNFKGEK